MVKMVKWNNRGEKDRNPFNVDNNQIELIFNKTYEYISYAELTSFSLFLVVSCECPNTQ